MDRRLLELPRDPRHDAHAGDVGPDLTHFELAATLGAARPAERRPATLRDWILDPQHVKPGNQMPDAAAVRRRSSQALVAYLESLR